jgi:hypothetical protein
VEQILQAADDRTFRFPRGQAADRGYVEAVEIDPSTGDPLGRWFKLNAFQNNYSAPGVERHFINCVFDGYDDFYSAADALGGTPGFDINATSPVGVRYNLDDVSSEDDYFDPNDPFRLLGPSSGCFPEFVFKSMGDYTSTDPAASGLAISPGRAGEAGQGVWVNSLFNLNRFAGRSVRLRFVFTGTEVFPGVLWADLFGNRLGNGTRGWNLDDVAVSGLVDTPLVLIPDTRPWSPVDLCPEPPDPEIPGHDCGIPDMTPTADAGPDRVTPYAGALITLDASGSRMDPGNFCVDGHLEYRWRIGGEIVSDVSTNPVFRDTPLFTTVYTVDVRCTAEPWCPDWWSSDSDSVTVTPASDFEVSGTPATLGTVEAAGETGGIVAVLTRWVEPFAGEPLTTSVLGVNIARQGGELRASPGGTPADQLREGLCHLGETVPAGDGNVELTEEIIPLAPAEILGYLATAVNDEGIAGTLGRGESSGGAGAFSRGRLNPEAPAACVP